MTAMQGIRKIADWFRLTRIPAELYEEYRKDQLRIFKQTVKWVMFVGSIFINFTFWIADFILYPDQVWEFFALRLVIAGAALSAYFLSKKVENIFWFEIIIIIWIAITAWAQTALLVLSDELMSPYVARINLAILGGLAFFPLSISRQVIMVFISWFPYYVIYFSTELSRESIKLLIIYTFVNLSIALFAFLMRHLHHLSHVGELKLRDELRKEREKLNALNQQQFRFFTNISHEFRTPLTLIISPIENLLKRKTDPETQQALTVMKRNSNHLLKLINQLLDLSKIEANSLSIHAHPVRIVQFTRYLASSFESAARQKNISFSLLCNENEDLILYIDPDKYEKVMNNILSNALKFTPEGGKIMISCNLHKPRFSNNDPASNPGDLQYFEVKIRDTGIGIPADKLDKIFNHFYQVDNSSTRKYEGTGIGLALSKELVELHHGKIHVNSIVAKGSEFIISLPLGKNHLSKEEIVSEQIEEYRPEKSTINLLPPQPLSGASVNGYQSAKQNAETILIIEDNEDMRGLLRMHLKREYAVIEAGDGEEGLKIAEKRQPALVISDIMMPKMDGLTFCRQLKSTEQISHIPVILLTARSLREHKMEGLETGADDYLNKPFDREELLIRIANLIEQRKQLRAKFQRSFFNVEPKSITVTSVDEKFITRAISVIEDHMDDPAFDTIQFAREMGMSRSNLNLKLKALTDLSTRMFIRHVRLKRAAQLLFQRAGNVSEICYAVGFDNLSHFAKAFKDQYGVSPSKYDNFPGHTIEKTSSEK